MPPKLWIEVKMLQDIRDKSQTWISKVIVGVIVLIMALYGFDAIFSNNNQKDVAADVDGTLIYEQGLVNAIQAQQKRMQEVLPVETMRDSILNGLIQQSLLVNAAKKAGMTVSTDTMDKEITQNQEFMVTGAFNVNRFDQVLSQMNVSRLQYREYLSQDIILNQLQLGLSQTAFVTEQEIDLISHIEKQSRNFSVAWLDIASESITITEENAKAYFDQHSSEYFKPEKMDLEFIELSLKKLAKKHDVSEDEIKTRYEREKPTSEEKRSAAHLLIEVNEQRSDKEAELLIRQLAEELKAGKDFGSLARTHSNDYASAKDGGQLPLTVKGVYDPNFDEVLFALGKEGEISEPTRTAFGWHLIKLTAIEASVKTPLEKQRSALTTQIREEKATQDYQDQLQQLKQTAFESSDLDEVSKHLQLEVQNILDVSSKDDYARHPLLSHAGVAEFAFNEANQKNGLNSDVIEIDSDNAVVLRVKAFQPKVFLTYEQVSAEVKRAALKQKSHDLLSEKSKMLVEMAQKDPKNSSIQTLNWKHYQNILRTDTKIEPALLRTVFLMPMPEKLASTTKDDATQDNLPAPIFKVYQSDDGFALIKLESVILPKEPLSKEEQGALTQFLSDRLGAQNFVEYVNWLQKNADIEIKPTPNSSP